MFCFFSHVLTLHLNRAEKCFIGLFRELYVTRFGNCSAESGAEDETPCKNHIYDALFMDLDLPRCTNYHSFACSNDAYAFAAS